MNNCWLIISEVLWHWHNNTERYPTNITLMLMDLHKAVVTQLCSTTFRRGKNLEIIYIYIYIQFQDELCRSYASTHLSNKILHKPFFLIELKMYANWTDPGSCCLPLGLLKRTLILENTEVFWTCFRLIKMIHKHVHISFINHFLWIISCYWMRRPVLFHLYISSIVYSWSPYITVTS